MHMIVISWEMFGNPWSKAQPSFFPFEKSAMITEIVDYPNKSVCRIWLAGGDLEELVEAEKKICDWARRHGCDGIEIIGRHGWKKVLKDYLPTSTVLVKDLKDE